MKPSLEAKVCNAVLIILIMSLETIDAGGQCGLRPYDSTRQRRPLTLTPRVVGGNFAYHGEHPWQVRVDLFSWHHCGAAIISEFWMLSAAHCFSRKDWKKEYFSIIVGDNDKTKQDEGEQKFEVDQIIIHRLYNKKKGVKDDKDIALIKVKPKHGKGIQFNDYVQPACLPTRKTRYRSGTKCIVSGWGNTDGKYSYPEILKAAEVPVISIRKCRSFYGRRRITPGMMCAGYKQGGIDTCDGDSGGPLICKIQGVYTLIGATSWGRGCAKPGYPGVYTRIQRFLYWIKYNIRKIDWKSALPTGS